MTDAAITASASDRGIVVVHRGNGDVRIWINDGVAPETLLAYARELDVTESALRRFFDVLGEASVNSTVLESTLVSWASRYKRVRADLEAFSPDDTMLQAAREEALEAIAAGDLDGAEDLLKQARTRWRALSERLQERAEQAKLSEFELVLGMAEVAMTKLRYPDAMARFADAARLFSGREAKPLARALRAWGIAEAEWGHFAEAHTHLADALRLDPAASALVHEAQHSLAQAARELGRHAEAEALLATLVQDLPDGSPEWLAAQVELAATLRETGAYDRARVVLDEALTGADAATAADSGRIRLLREDALVLTELGQVENALAQIEAASRVVGAVLPDAHPLARRVALDHAGLLRRAGRLAEAETAYHRIEERLADLGPDHPELITVLDHLGTLALEQGHLQVAHAHLDRGKKLADRTFERTGHHADHGQIINNLGCVLLAQGQPDTALELFEDADFIFRKALGSGHKDRATVVANQARALFARGRLVDAVERAKEALRRREAALGPSHPDVAESLATLGAYCHQLDQHDLAARYLARARGIYEGLLPSEAPALARTLFNEASLALDLGRPGETVAVAARALDLAARGLGPRHHFIVQIAETLGVAQALAGDREAARSTLAEAHATAITLWPEDHPVPRRIATWQCRLGGTWPPQA